MLNPTELRALADELVELARKLGPEGEGVDFADREFELEELVQLRSFLSSTRVAIDMTNSGLARYWDETYPGEEFEDEFKVWSVGKSKVRRPMDGDALIAWFASLDTERLAKVVNPNRLTEVLKVTGMSPVERETLVVEEYRKTSGISIQSKEKKP